MRVSPVIHNYLIIYTHPMPNLQKDASPTTPCICKVLDTNNCFMHSISLGPPSEQTRGSGLPSVTQELISCLAQTANCQLPRVQGARALVRASESRASVAWTHP